MLRGQGIPVGERSLKIAVIGPAAYFTVRIRHLHAQFYTVVWNPM